MGLGTMDEFKISYFEDEFVGLSIRIINPKSNERTIYWADTANPFVERALPLLKEQVAGKFNNGIGEFYGKVIFNGKEVKVKFTWKKETINTAQWEQAYFDEIKQEWEINWIMILIYKAREMILILPNRGNVLMVSSVPLVLLHAA